HVDEPKFAAGLQLQDDVRVLLRGLAAGRTFDAPAHAEVHNEHASVVEVAQDVLASPVDASDLRADERVDELLLGLVPADDARQLHLNLFDSPTDGVPLAVA